MKNPVFYGQQSGANFVTKGLLLSMFGTFVCGLLFYGLILSSVDDYDEQNIQYRLETSLMQEKGFMQLFPRDNTPPLQGNLTMTANVQGGSLYYFTFQHSENETLLSIPSTLRKYFTDGSIRVDLDDDKGITLAETLCGYNCVPPSDQSAIKEWYDFTQTWPVAITVEFINLRATSSTVIHNTIIPDTITKL